MKQHDLFKPQTHFGLPIKDRTEPLFWIKELRILSSLSSESAQEIRRVIFRKGLNVVWAKAPANVSHDIDEEQRIAGHAAGKSTLCRFIRFALGEKHCADDAMSDNILHAFPKGYIVAEIYLDNKQWVIARAMSNLCPSSCATDCTIDTFLSGNESIKPITSYFESLNGLRKSITGIRGFPDNMFLKFSHILPWLTRDQGCSFSDLAVWRKNATAGGFLSKEKSMLLLRSIVAPGAENEIELIKNQICLHEQMKFIEDEQHNTEVMQGYFKQELAAIAKRYGKDSDLVEAWLDSLENELADSLESDGVTKDDESELNRLETMRSGLESLCAIREKEIVGSDEAYQQTLLKIKELNKASRLNAVVSEIEEAAREHPRRKYCCMPLEIAEKACPIFKQAERQTLSEKHLFDATNPERLLCELEESAASHKTFLDAERKQLNELKVDLAAAKRDISSYKKVLASKRRQHVWKSAQTGCDLAVLRQYKSAQKTQIELTTTYIKVKSEHNSCGDSISTRRKSNNAKYARLKEIFDRLIGIALGSHVNGNIHVSKGTVTLGCSYNGDLDSAAIEAVKTVCFDFAALVLSIEGNGNHPRFLLHDSPRVADLTEQIFHQYFWLVKELEEQSGNNPTFQYFITTTTEPPLEFRQEPYLCLQLDASIAEGRLLKVNL